MAKRIIAKESFRESFPSLILYREDIDAIIDAMTPENDSEEGPVLEDGEYTYDSVDDLREVRGNVVKRLTISGFGGLLQFEMSSVDTILRLSVWRQEEYKEEYRKLKQMLSTTKKGNIINWLTKQRCSPAFPVYCSLALMFALIVVPFVYPFGGTWVEYVWLAGLAVASLMFYCAAAFAFKNLGGMTTIYLLHRHEVEGRFRRMLWEKVSADLTVRAITAVACLIAGSVVTALTVRGCDQPTQPKTEQATPTDEGQQKK